VKASEAAPRLAVHGRNGRPEGRRAAVALTLYGVVAVGFMTAMYALERRGPGYVLAFAAGCVASSLYGFFAGTWPFGVVELVWSVIALRRWSSERAVSSG
jgi:hypothetical protein